MNDSVDILRTYSKFFTCASFSRMLDDDTMSCFNRKCFDEAKSKIKTPKTYKNLLTYMYRELCKNYRCEYVYKNEIAKYVAEIHKNTGKTVLMNEFKVGNAIVDIAVFNGESVAYEIKTELDSNRRASLQISTYKKFFDKTYIVTSENVLSKYENIDKDVGIFILDYQKGKIQLREHRKAKKMSFSSLDVTILMKILHTSEYKNIIKNKYGSLPNSNSFEMYSKCLELMKKIPKKELKTMVYSEIKKRKKCINDCKIKEKEFSHIVQGLNLSKEDYFIMISKLKEAI